MNDHRLCKQKLQFFPSAITLFAMWLLDVYVKAGYHHVIDVRISDAIIKHRIYGTDISVLILSDITQAYPDSKVHGANMGPSWGRQDPRGPHLGPMSFPIWIYITVFHIT